MTATLCLLVGTLASAADATHSPATRPAATVTPADPGALDAFRRECAARFAAADDAVNMAVTGRDGWFFFASEFRHLSVGPFWGPDAAKANRLARPEYADPLPAILDFKEQLAKAGVDLVLVPVPPKAAVHPDKVSDAVKDVAGRVDADDVAFYDLLRKEGVRVIDLVPEFARQAREHPDDDPYCRQDTHWSGRGCILTAQQILTEVKDRPWLKDVKRQAFDAETKPLEITGDLYAAVRPPPTMPKERVPLRFVGARKDGAIEPVEPDRSSPIVLLGDSHCQVFYAGGRMHTAGAGLADQLALEFGTPIDVVTVDGAGGSSSRLNLMRLAKQDPDYLKRKRLVVWCFAAREFTEGSGWQKVKIGGNAE